MAGTSSPKDLVSKRAVDALARDIRSCRICIEQPDRLPLPHSPNPVFRISHTARLAICGQAPGTRVHASGIPFTDPSGERLRAWMGVTDTEFYDVSRVSIIPMGFCFPGLDAKGGDRPPRRECARHWHTRVFDTLAQFEVVLLVGGYAQKWHLGRSHKANVTETVMDWRRYAMANASPRLFPLPHPSWRNNTWIKANPWFEDETLPALKSVVADVLAQP